MPGSNCSFPSCPVSRYKIYKGTTIFKIPNRKDDFNQKWRKDMLGVLLKYREADFCLKEKLDGEGDIYICERHFAPHDLELTKTGRKTIRLGALPTINLPTKSHMKVTTPRRHLSVVQDFSPKKKNASAPYKSFKELCTRLKELKSIKLNDWRLDIITENEKLCLSKIVPKFSIPKFKISIESPTFDFTITVFGWLLPEDHNIYKEYFRCFRYKSVFELLELTSKFSLCKGMKENTPNSKMHCIPQENLDDCQQPPLIFKRSENCSLLLLKEDEVCVSCLTYDRVIKQKTSTEVKRKMKPAHKNAPLKNTSHERVVLALKQERLKCSELQNRIKDMEQRIVQQSVRVDSQLSDDIKYIVDNNIESASPFMKLFWKQQVEAFKNNERVGTYHPMIIRFSLSLAAKSPAAYDELRDSKVLVLPSRRTLRDYKNCIRPSAGFNAEIINELITSSKSLAGPQRFISLVMDEMKIEQNLVYDKNSNELIGFVDLGDPILNYGTFADADDLASYVLVFYVRGILSDLKFNLAYFATKCATSFQILPIFWEAVSILELKCDLHVISVVSDGASPNRKFFRLHEAFNDIENDCVYKTINLFAEDRFIWFISDPPHLIKTLRNALYHSKGDFSGTRQLWNAGKMLLWSHIKKLYDDQECTELKLLPKLTQEHIHLNPYSIMNVRLASQVLSKSVANILYAYYPTETHETAKFCEYMNNFFDIFNARNQIEGFKKRNEFLNPFKSADDFRLKWLREMFLPFLSEWKSNVEKREGSFTRTERDQMFIPWQTYEGLKVSCLSLIEIVPFLLSHGAEFVLTEKLNQDPLEQYFGRHRGIGRRSENPTLYQFGYNSNTLRMQRSIAPVTGNTSGGQRQKRRVSWSKVDETKLRRRQKKKKII